MIGCKIGVNHISFVGFTVFRVLQVVPFFIHACNSSLHAGVHLASIKESRNYDVKEGSLVRLVICF